MNTIAEIVGKRKVGRARLHQFNLMGCSITRRTDYCEQLRETKLISKVWHQMVAHAEDLHSQYSQYNGCWDEWKLGRMKANWLGKHHVPGTPHLVAGDFVLVSPQATLSELEGGTEFCCSIFNTITGNNCQCSVKDVEIL